MTRSAVLLLEGVHAGYGSTEVLGGVDLVLHEGEIACLVGPSGCGKSTLLRCVAGFERISAGTIALKNRVVAGKGVHESPDRRRVGIVFQDYALFPHLTVHENVGFGLTSFDRGARTTKIKKLLDTIDLPGSGSRYPHELSGGQQQRVALARALAVEPDLLLLDEPFSNLDPELSKRMLQELRRLLREIGVTVLMVTHDRDEAFDVADVLGVMSEGRILQWGEPRSLYSRPNCVSVAEALGDCMLLAMEGGNTELGRIEGSHASGRLLVRPSDVVIAGDAQVSGVIVGASFRGTHVILDLRLESGLRLRSFATGDAMHMVVGDRVGVALRPTELVVLD